MTQISDRLSGLVQSDIRRMSRECDAVGGINLLKGFAGPFGDVKFCPTGGVTVESASQFLALPNVVVCGGTWLTPADAVAAKDWAKITKLAKEASAIKPAA